MAILGFFANALGAFVSCLAYGYVEKSSGIEGSGALIAVLLAGYLVAQRGGRQVFIAPALVSIHMYLLLQPHFVDMNSQLVPVSMPNWSQWAGLTTPQASFLLFLLLVSQLFFSRARGLDGSYFGEDVTVELQPYEAQIRAILMTFDHTKLHTVDTLLRQNKGYEDILLKRLKTQYGIVGDDQAAGTGGARGWRGSSSPSPSQRSRSRSPPPGSVSAGSNSAAAADWNVNAELFREEISKLVGSQNPSLLRHLPNMFEDYNGREEELLRLIYLEFDMEYVPPAHMRRYGKTVAPIAHNPDPNSSPFASRGQTILELAKEVCMCVYVYVCVGGGA